MPKDNKYKKYVKESNLNQVQNKAMNVIQLSH